MEILLAIVVASAVIFFGALISMGNERQRKAIDDLREQVTMWAIQDLQLKRERLAREVQVSNPHDWFNKIAMRVGGPALKLQFVEAFYEPHALLFTAEASDTKIIFSPFSPNDIRQRGFTRRGRLSQYTESNPLLSLPKKIGVREMSILNAGNLFDLELPLAWKGLTGQDAGHMERLWLYII